MKALRLVVVALMAVAVGSAAPLCTLGVGDVLTLNPAGCSLGSMLFDNFSVSDNDAVTTYVVGINGAYSGGPNNILRFTISPSVPPAGGVDIILGYRVSALVGVDVELGNFSGLASVTEVACAVQPVAGICPAGSVLARIAATPGSPYAEAFFSPHSNVWIMKDINIPNGATMSDFANSHAIPEPVTLSLIGVGLLGLGLLRRRLKK